MKGDTMRWFGGKALLVLGLGLFMAGGLAGSPKEGGKAVAQTRVFELRTYHAAPGKMKALEDRFRDHTLKLFKKHGLTVVGFWKPSGKEADKKLIYILAFPSQEAADKSWQAFREDADWLAAKKESEKDGALVLKVDSVFMHPTDYSPIR